jgi:hypothetical protein
MRRPFTLFRPVPIASILALIALSLLLAACTMKKSVLTGGPVDGVVVDATTQQPIAGAMVLVKWRGVLPTIHSNSVPCYHAELATTDAQGRYHINSWRVETKGHVEWMAHISQTGPVEPVAYKAGYRMSARQQEDTMGVLMDPVRGTTLQRLGYLAAELDDRQLACDADEKTQIPIYRAAYEEGARLAQTPTEQRIVDSLLVVLESAQFGNSEALDRKTQRKLERLEQEEDRERR